MPEITTGGKRKVLKADMKPFKIDGVTFLLIRPKTSMLFAVAITLEPGRPLPDGERMDAMLRFTQQMLQYIAEEPPSKDGELRGVALLRRRLNDAEDTLDLPELFPVLTTLMDGWFARPTGSPRASTSSRRARTGSTSRARTR